jgi:hypothetical protein
VDHQDEHASLDSLDHWGKLNVEMDRLAKAYMPIAMQHPRHYLLQSEPWSIWIGDKKSAKIFLLPFTT